MTKAVSAEGVVQEDHNRTDFILAWDRATSPGCHFFASTNAGIFSESTVFLVRKKKKKDAKKHNLKVKMEGNSHLLCEHQDVFCAASSSMGCHQMHSLFPLCDVVLRWNLTFFNFFFQVIWFSSNVTLHPPSKQKGSLFPSPVSNRLPHLNSLKHLSSTHSNKLHEIGTFYVQRWWHERLQTAWFLDHFSTSCPCYH